MVTVALQGVAATGAVGTVLLRGWTTIGDSQTPSWAAITDTQTPNWQPVS